MSKYLFGSQLLQLKYPRDGDWLSFVEKHPKDLTDSQKRQGVRSIPFNRIVIQHFIQGKTSPQDEYKSVHLFELSCGFHHEADYPFKDFNILEYKEVWVDQLKAYINLRETEERATKSELLHKTFYNVLYQYCMIIENTHWISDKARIDVQRIHDLEMPSSYFYTLRDLINTL